MSRNVLITGASSGIGLPLASRYLAAGWSVVAHHCRPATAALIDLKRQAGSRLQLWQADFSDADSLDALIAAADPRLDGCDGFVHLAVAQSPTAFPGATARQMIGHFAANTVSGFLLLARLGPAMAARGWGRVVLGSSIGVKFGGGDNSFAYALSKHALEFLPKAARAWAGNGVLVNVLRIGVTDTALHAGLPGKDLAHRVALIPAKRAATPQEIAETLFWLGSDANSYITGQVLAASGGE